jgi:NADH:ubiquinone oxidoreductase subunit 3 (subunit A)
MIAFIITVVALLVLGVLVILLFPVTISFNSVRSGGTIDGNLGINWIVFIFIYTLKEKQLEIHIFGRSIFRHIPSGPPEIKPSESEPERERKKSGKMPPVRDFLNMAGPMIRLFKGFIYAFRIKYLDIEVIFGLKDPSCTGIITGFLHAAGLSRTGHNLRWTPDFTGQAFDWDVKGKAALMPVRLIPPVARFITNRQVMRSGWRMLWE